MKTQFFILIAFIIFIGCQNQTTNETPVATTEQSAPPPINPFDTLPLLPRPAVEEIFNQLDVVSINFLNGLSPITVYGDQQSKNLYTALLTGLKPTNPICTNPFATFSFSGKGKALAQGSIFFQQGCTYLIFQDINTNQYTYICQMGNKGINTLNQIIQGQTQKQ